MWNVAFRPSLEAPGLVLRDGCVVEHRATHTMLARAASCCVESLRSRRI